MTTTTSPDLLQRRVLTTLVTSQVLGGVGLSAGVAVGALLAEQVGGSTALAGLGGTFQTLGSALVAIPLAAITARRGRRPALMAGYAAAALGAIGLVAAGIVSSFALLLVASVLFGGATAANSQSRFAAADLAAPGRRARDLSLIMWATTIGSVLGPNLVGPSAPVAARLGLPPLTGPYVFSLVALLLAVLWLHLRLRPDPLLVAEQRAAAASAHAQGQGRGPDAVSAPPRGGVAHGIRVLIALPAARLGLIAMAVGHAVMVAVMVMTPIHMGHGHAALTAIGFTISMHILGMFAFSPLVGWLVDRVGGRLVAVLGSAVLSTATLLASATAAGESPLIVIALTLLGLGWSGTMISGSALVVAAVPVHERPAAQGAADVVVGLVAAGAGALSGLIVQLTSFHVLALVALGFAVLLGLTAALLPTGPVESAPPR